MMARHVVDTNVLVVADERADHARSGCIEQCIAELEMLSTEVVVLDFGWEILGEYQANMDPTSQAGPGFMFYKWLLTSQTNQRCVHFVTLTPEADWSYVEFPHDADLAAFDRSDRKFVAAACAAGPDTRLVTAVDTDFHQYRAELGRYLALDIPPACC